MSQGDAQPANAADCPTASLRTAGVQPLIGITLGVTREAGMALINARALRADIVTR
jgi:hypothetical protein